MGRVKKERDKSRKKSERQKAEINDGYDHGGKDREDQKEQQIQTREEVEAGKQEGPGGKIDPRKCTYRKPKTQREKGTAERGVRRD